MNGHCLRSTGMACCPCSPCPAAIVPSSQNHSKYRRSASSKQASYRRSALGACDFDSKLSRLLPRFPCPYPTRIIAACFTLLSRSWKGPGVECLVTRPKVLGSIPIAWRGFIEFRDTAHFACKVFPLRNGLKIYCQPLNPIDLPPADLVGFSKCEFGRFRHIKT